MKGNGVKRKSGQTGTGRSKPETEGNAEYQARGDQNSGKSGKKELSSVRILNPAAGVSI